MVAVDHLIGMKFGMGILEDMHHLKYKSIRSVADLLQDQFGLALVRLKNAEESRNFDDRFTLMIVGL